MFFCSLLTPWTDLDQFLINYLLSLCGTICSKISSPDWGREIQNNLNSRSFAQYSRKLHETNGADSLMEGRVQETWMVLKFQWKFHKAARMAKITTDRCPDWLLCPMEDRAEMLKVLKFQWELQKAVHIQPAGILKYYYLSS